MNETRSEQVFFGIQADIALGKILPGTVLNEVALARKFNVSRTPVREALLRLEHEGIIEKSAGRLMVAELSYSKAADLYTARAALEGMCIRLATRVALPEQLDALDAMIAEARAALDAGELEEVARLNAAFHNRIQEIAANQFLIDSIRKIDLWTQRYRRASVVAFGRAVDALADHVEIVTVMRRGEASLAESIMRRHIMQAGLSFLEAIQLFFGVDSETPASIAIARFEEDLKNAPHAAAHAAATAGQVRALTPASAASEAIAGGPEGDAPIRRGSKRTK